MAGNPLEENKTVTKKYRFVIESMNVGVEKQYYWLLRFMQNPGPYGIGFEKVLKLRDLFDASASSSFFGNIEQRKTIQQGEVGKWLGALSQMTQSIFKMIHELRILDERLQLYDEDDKGDHEAQIALKTVWTNLVEGGTQNPGSVLGLSAVGGPGFVTLADHFFAIDVKNSKDISAKVKAMETNEKVRSIIATKLKQFIVWKENTSKELRQRKNFSLRNLKTHYYTMKMYINWIRPYLNNLKSLNLEGDLNDPDLVRAFESAKIELELLALNTKEYKKYFPAIRVKIKYVVKPQMAFQSEYQKGPMHMGRTDIEISGYVVTQKEIDDYLKAKDEEDFNIINSLNEGFEGLQEDLKKYLEEAEMLNDKKGPEGDKLPSSEFFSGFFTGLGNTFGFADFLKFKNKKKKGSINMSKREENAERNAAKNAVQVPVKTLRYVFKKSNKMITE